MIFLRSQVGHFVEISWIALDTTERAEHIPDSTKKVPLVARVKGFALASCEVGEELEVLTLSGRIMKGKLIDPEPKHTYGFGKPQLELLRIGPQLRKEVL